MKRRADAPVLMVSIRAAQARYRRSEKVRVARRRYKSSFSGLLTGRLVEYRRRALEYGVETDLTRADLKRLVQKWFGQCAYCGLTVRYNFDHVVPMQRGGPNVPANMVPACVNCNRAKKSRNVFSIWRSLENSKDRRRYLRVASHMRAGRRCELVRPLLLRDISADRSDVNF